MKKLSPELSQKLSLLPAKPGCYLMKDQAEKIIYVGKAKVLKNRVRSYFNNSAKDAKTLDLVDHIQDIDYIIVNSEREALVLENNLIKKHKPRYNIALRDDKQYPFIAVTNDVFPRIFVTRQTPRDGTHYFGPYTDVRALRGTLRLLEWIFPHRTCKRVIPQDQIRYKKACINYQMKKCPAPCIGKISKVEYNEIIRNIIKFLNGRNEEVVAQLKDEMQAAAAKLEFERAAGLRDKITSIQRVNRKRTLFFEDQKDRDVIGLYKEDQRAAVAVLKIVEGKLLAKESYKMKNVSGRSEAEILSAFLYQYYESRLDRLPWRVLLQIKPEDYIELQALFNQRFHIPQRGESMKLIKIASENAFNRIEEDKLSHLRSKNRTIFPVKDLKDRLNLKKLPRRMICIDISNIQGSDVVSSLVYFFNGKPRKKNYRRFIMKSFTGQNDYAAMEETMLRYFQKVETEEMPDLIVIDGGKGQLHSAERILKQLKIEGVEIISLAKRVEEVFKSDQENSILLPRSSAGLRLLINIRDTTHDQAVSFHRLRRSKRTLRSGLDDIIGIGPKTRFLLLKRFGSVEGVKNASVKELEEIKGIGRKLAENIRAALSDK